MDKSAKSMQKNKGKQEMVNNTRQGKAKVRLRRRRARMDINNSRGSNVELKKGPVYPSPHPSHMG